MAIAEYAPGSEVIADGKLYKSRYIRMESDRKRTAAYGYYAKCRNCEEYNFTHNPQVRVVGQECISCHKKYLANHGFGQLSRALGSLQRGPMLEMHH